jgi:hypothetical protein
MTTELQDDKYRGPSKIFEDGQWWYKWNGQRQSIKSLEEYRNTRMEVAGEYISVKHPLHKPGRYATFEDAWSHEELDRVSTGHIYLVINPAWPEWVKLGMAVDAHDRLRSFNTSSPFRDYEVAYHIAVKDKRQTEKSAHRLLGMIAKDRKGEWFKVPLDKAVEVLDQLEPLATD